MWKFFSGKPEEPAKKKPVQERRSVSAIQKAEVNHTRPHAEQGEYATGEVVDAAEMGGGSTERELSIEGRVEQAEKMVNVFAKVNVWIDASRQITNITNVTNAQERPPVVAARERVRMARAGLMSQLAMAAALVFGAHHAATETAKGNTRAEIERVKGDQLEGVAGRAMETLQGASLAYLRFEDRVSEGINEVMEHARRDIEAVRREEQQMVAEREQARAEAQRIAAAQSIPMETVPASTAVSSDSHESGRGTSHHRTGTSRRHQRRIAER